MRTRRGPGSPEWGAPMNQGSSRARLAGTGQPAGAWRPGSVPEQLGVAGLTAAGAAVAYRAALAANPFVLVLAGFIPVMAVLMAARAMGRLAPPAQWPESHRRQSYWVVGVLAAASWAFQLHRFGWV